HKEQNTLKIVKAEWYLLLSPVFYIISYIFNAIYATKTCIIFIANPHPFTPLIKRRMKKVHSTPLITTIVGGLVLAYLL
ncbi:hypothetical protein ACV33M_32890, partial [Pseudomonas aeruginosa]